MIVTVVAVMCHMMVEQPTIAPDRDCTAEEARVEEIVTSSDMDPNVDFMSCMIHAQLGLADWKVKHPIYFKPSWRVGRVKCVPGHYEIKGAA
jgi:hypothetical protein